MNPCVSFFSGEEQRHRVPDEEDTNAYCRYVLNTLFLGYPVQVDATGKVPRDISV